MASPLEMLMGPKPPPRPEQEIFDELGALCVSPGYIEALARFGLRDNVIIYNSKGLDGDALAKTLSRDERLIRTELSTLVGLMLRQPLDLNEQDPAIIDGYCEKTEALLHELHDRLAYVWRESLTPESAREPGFNPFRNAEALREPIFYAGEAAFDFQYRDFAVRKYLADDAWLEKHFGFAITTAREVLSAIRDVQSATVMAHRAAILRGEQPAAVSGLAFTLEDVARKARLDPAKVSPVLDAFTAGKDDRNAAFKTLSDFNIANATPLIRLDNGDYVLFHSTSLAEALYDSPFFWMMADKTYRQTASDHRGAFTEAFAAERLGRVFGAARVFTNVIIPGAKGVRRGEIDALVLFGDRAIVVQAKAKRLTLEARKGNDLQLQKDFKGAVQDACDQAMDCASILLEPGVLLLDDKGRPIAVDGSIKRVYPICLVLDHYPALFVQVRHLLKAATVDKVAPPFVMDVFALDVMTEMLTSPLRLISYLELRARAGDTFLAHGELTILGYHLSHNLWRGGQVDMVMLHDDVASSLDAAMMVRREGLPGARTPEGILTRFQGTTVARLIATIDNDPNPATLELGLFLLELEEVALRGVSSAMDDLCNAARRDHKPHNGSIPSGSAGLTLQVNRMSDEEAMEQLRAQCLLRKYERKAERWFGISLNPDTGGARFGLMLDAPWRKDPVMDVVASNLPQPQAFRGKMPRFTVAKPQRNAPCHCGSGVKYKKCCLPGEDAGLDKRGW